MTVLNLGLHLQTQDAAFQQLGTGGGGENSAPAVLPVITLQFDIVAN